MSTPNDINTDDIDTNDINTKDGVPNDEVPSDEEPSIVSSIGYVLAASYPILALSTGTRAIVRLFFRDSPDLFAPTMSAIAALLYIIATVGFAYRRKWSWWLSIGSLGIETVLTLVVGGLSYVNPELVGRTVWRHFGEDYGYFPLFQPILGLVWLYWPETLRQYGFGSPTTKSQSTES